MNKLVLINSNSFYKKIEGKTMNKKGAVNALYTLNSYGYSIFILNEKRDKGEIELYVNFLQNEGLALEVISKESLCNNLVINQLERSSQVILIDLQLELNNPNKIFITFSPDSDTIENYLPAKKEVSVGSWSEIIKWAELFSGAASIYRNTSETQISASILLNSTGKSEINSGLAFFDHMLEQIAKHAACQLFFKAIGDLQVDVHHTIEDSALVLGSLFKQALGNKAGIERYGFCLPMDDAIVVSAIDFGGRPWLNWNVEFCSNEIGGIPNEMFYHFFKSFSDAAQCNIYIQAKGENMHHLVECIFKSFGKSIKNAIRREAFNFEIPSTKGIL